MKKIYFLIIAIVCVMSVKAQYGGGDGVTTPYEIETTAHLVTLSTDEANWDKKFILMNDLDMDGIEFLSIGYFTTATWADIYFTGEFDGNNKTISNLTLTPRKKGDGTLGQTYNLGFFGLAKGDKVVAKNLGFVNLSATQPNINRLGGIIGTSEEGASIDNCFVDGGSITAAGGVGAMIGWVKTGDPSVTNCYSNLEVLVGVPGTDKYKGSGGMIGTVEKGAVTVTNVAVYGSKAAGDTQGAVIGIVEADGSVTATNAYYKQGSGATDANATEITDLSAQSSYTGFDFATKWEIDASRNYAILQGFAGLPLAISDVNISNTKVICIGKTLYIDTDEVEQGVYAIYNLSGVLVAQGEFAGSSFTETLNIQKGIYIVKVGALATKIKVD